MSKTGNCLLRTENETRTGLQPKLLQNEQKHTQNEYIMASRYFRSADIETCAYVPKPVRSGRLGGCISDMVANFTDTGQLCWILHISRAKRKEVRG